MRITNAWKDYELLDCSDGERLERWGDIILIRPDPQVIWKTEKKNKLWYDSHARYHRSNTGGGSWQFYKKIPEVWQIKFNDLEFNLKPMSFKHTGVFPEQACNWELVRDIIKNSGREDVKVLNLFAYTGAATVSALKAGASVVHVDASKGMVQWARENAALSGMSDYPIRWIVDDCIKFVQREIRRGNKYDAIIMDPPSYGRGPGGEVWKIEDSICQFVRRCTLLLSDAPLFFIINSYTTGLAPTVLINLMKMCLPEGHTESSEIGLKITSSDMVLPCGATCRWEK